MISYCDIRTHAHAQVCLHDISSWNSWVQHEVCRTSFWQGHGHEYRSPTSLLSEARRA